MQLKQIADIYNNTGNNTEGDGHSENDVKKEHIEIPINLNYPAKHKQDNEYNSTKSISSTIEEILSLDSLTDISETSGLSSDSQLNKCKECGQGYERWVWVGVWVWV